MMKGFKTVLCLAGAVISLAVLPMSGEGAEESTHVSVTDTGGASGHLRINKISYVGFGEKVLKKSANSYYASTDLVLEIEDSRTTNSPWQLNLKLSPFVNEKNEQLKGISYHLGIGKVSGNQQTVTGEEYSSASNTEGDEFSKVLISKGTEKGIFTYTIKAADIWLYIPPQQPQGNFQSEKTWLLVDSI